MPTAHGGVAASRRRGVAAAAEGAEGGKIYVIGGEGNPAPGAQGVFDDNEVYDTATDTWEVLAPMRTPRHGTGAVAVDGTVYVPGGGTQQGFELTDASEAFSP
ncbi:kelch repeat-containing protein [Sorangium sp. So ce1182]|uniref:kelch repeat-containing protein n=1 Tax=Sorangium sp. So ce1182 TaxID=3133334 RepID=UPI003F61C0BC